MAILRQTKSEKSQLKAKLFNRDEAFQKAIVSDPVDGHHGIDPLSQLKANISQLEDLQSQLRFMNNEVKSLIK